MWRDETSRIEKEQLQEICSTINKRKKIMCYVTMMKISLREIQQKTLKNIQFS